MIKKLLLPLFVSLVLLVSPVVAASAVNAQGTGVSAENIIQSYLNITFRGACSLEEIVGIFCIIGKLINYLLLLVGAVSLVMFVIGGLQYMASGGDEKAITTAKSTITYSILGLFVVLLASAIVSTVLSVVGLAP